MDDIKALDEHIASAEAKVAQLRAKRQSILENLECTRIVGILATEQKFPVFIAYKYVRSDTNTKHVLNKFKDTFNAEETYLEYKYDSLRKEDVLESNQLNQPSCTYVGIDEGYKMRIDYSDTTFMHGILLRQRAQTTLASSQ